jgi:hypothetical protein
MKLRPFLTDDGVTILGYVHWCPGCKEPHAIHTGAPNHSSARWSFDGNMDAPTFEPSINRGPGYCHYFIRSGVIDFCSDSRHELAGQHVPLPEWDGEWP